MLEYDVEKSYEIALILKPMSLGAVAVLRAIKPNPSSEKENPEAAVIVKTRAFPAADWVVGVEKKLLAPLICAALLKPELLVNALNDEALLTAETVMPLMEAAELLSEPPVKSKLASVTASL